MAKFMYSDQEKSDLVAYVNKKLSLTLDVKDESIFEGVKQSVLLCNLINAIEPGTIPADKIIETPNTAEDITQNHEVMLTGAKSLGINVQNVTTLDLSTGTRHLILGILWQLVRHGVLKEVCEVAVTVNIDSALPPEQILLLWLNQHLKESDVKIVVTNFGEDLSDGVVLTNVLHHVGASAGCDKSPLDIEDLIARAEAILKSAEKIDCRKFVEARDITEGNSRLLILFVAFMFMKFPELGPSQEALEWEQKYMELAALVDAQAQEWFNMEMSLKQDIETEQQEMEEAKNQIEEVKNNHAKISSDKENVITEKISVQQQLNDASNTLTQVTSTKDELVTKLEESQKTIAETTEKVYQSEDRVADLKEKGDRLREELERAKEKNSKLKNENSKAKEDIQNSLQQVNSLSEVKSKLEGEKEKLTKARKLLNKEKKSMQEELSQAEGKIKLQDEMISVLNETVNEVKGLLEDEKKKAEELLKQQKEKQEIIAKLKARIAELEAELEIAKARIRELEKQIAMHLKVMEGKKKEGVLQKLSPYGNKRLQKRWFVLRGVTLIYYYY